MAYSFIGYTDLSIVPSDESAISRIKSEQRSQNHLDDKFLCLNYAMSDSKSTLEFETSDSNYGDHRVRTTQSNRNARELFGESQRQVISVEADALDSILARMQKAYS